MRVICSYCGILFDLKEPLRDDSETHGICEECLPWVLKNIEIFIHPGNPGEIIRQQFPVAGGSRRQGPKGSDRIDAFSSENKERP